MNDMQGYCFLQPIDYVCIQAYRFTAAPEVTVCFYGTAGENKKGFRNNRKPEAGVVRIELTSKVLETPILPLNHTPICYVFSTLIIIPHN